MLSHTNAELDDRSGCTEPHRGCSCVGGQSAKRPSGIGARLGQLGHGVLQDPLADPCEVALEGGVVEPENAKRTLRIGREVISVLCEQRRRQILERMAAGPAWKDGDFVFTTSVGTPLDSRNLTRAFQAALALAGLPRQRFHDLRHATATLLLERGEELGVVSKVLGHSTVTTTLDTYGHLTSGMSQRVADRMDVIVRRPASGA